MTMGHTRRFTAFAHLCALLLLVWMVGCGGSSNNNNGSNNNGSGTTPGSSNPGSTGGNGGGGSSSATYVYLGDSTQGGGAFAYKLDSSGNLTQVSGSPFVTSDSAGASYGSLAVANGYVYVSNFSENGGPGSVIAMQIDPSTGALTQKGGGVSATDTSYSAVRLMVASPDGKTVYAVTQTAVTALSTSGGTPSVLNSQTLSDGNVWAFVVSNGFAYAGIQDGNPKTGFAQPVIKKITLGSNGSLADAGQTVATLSDANIPMDLALDPNGKYLAATTGMNDSAISVFSIGSGGSLTPVAGSPFAETVGIGQKLSFDPSGKYLYEVTNEEAVPNSENVIVFSVRSNGTLSQVQTVSMPNNVHVSGLVVKNAFVFIANEATDGLSGTVTVLSRDSNSGKVTMAGTGNANKAIGQVGVSP